MSLKTTNFVKQRPPWARLISNIVRFKTKFVNFEFLKGLSSKHSTHTVTQYSAELTKIEYLST